MRKTVSFLAFALLCSGACHAQDDSTRGFAFLFGIGPTTIEDEDGPDDVFDGSDTGWNLEVEYRFSTYFALGVSRTSFGEDTDFFNGADTNIEVDGTGYFIRGYLPVSDRFTLSARFGETAYDADVEPGGGNFFPDSAIDFGGAADFSINERLAFRLEHRLLDGDRQEEGSITTIGLRWQF
ncbi:MAG: outer membrane beta-barrel protein [Pseudomonadota bacterium]